MADILEDGDSDENIELKINKSYADNYDTWRGKEELQKFSDRYGEEAVRKLDHSESESSTSTEEDEDAKELTPQLEKQFFKALSCLKQKDPRIYDANTKFFEKPTSEATTEATAEKLKKKKKEKSMFLRDYERKMLLERGGQISSDEEDLEAIERSASPSFVQEQRAIKQSFQEVLHNDSSGDEARKDGIGGLFKPRQKSRDEQSKEEEDYRAWLVGRKEELGDKEDAAELAPLKTYWTDPKLEQKEVFLRDYIINKRYLEDEDGDYVPTYEEVVHDSDADFSEDERNVERMEQFEHKYNFRFEEPDQEFVKRYPRTMASSLRLRDERRTAHREEVKERKAREKEARRQELKQLKAVKRREITERLEKLRQITGNADVGFEDNDLNEDFDPEQHDRRMQALFDSEFYQGEAEEEKPEFPDLDQELEIENWDQYEPEQGGADKSGDEPHCEDPDFNMDCDYDPRAALEQEMMASQTRRKKGKKRSQLAEVLAKKKPRFEPGQQQLEQYMDEYYGMDYEDIVGDLPCRFKYRDVVPNSYGLTVEEILMADDKELNRWCSLKKTCQYRPDSKEWYEVQAYSKKGSLEHLKRKVLPSLFKQEGEESDEAEEQSKKKKKKKKKNKNKMEDETNGTAALDDGLVNGKLSTEKEKKVKKSKSSPNKSDESNANSVFPSKEKKSKKSSPSKPGERNEGSVSPSKEKKSKKSSLSNGKSDEKNDSSESPSKEKKSKKSSLRNGKSDERNDSSESPSKEKKTKNESLQENGSSPAKGKKRRASQGEPEADQSQVKKKKLTTESGDEKQPEQPTTNKTKKKKKKKKKKPAEKVDSTASPDKIAKGGKKAKFNQKSGVQSTKSSDKTTKGGKKAKFASQKSAAQPGSDISDSRLKAYGINPKKFKNKLKYGKK